MEATSTCHIQHIKQSTFYHTRFSNLEECKLRLLLKMFSVFKTKETKIWRPTSSMIHHTLYTVSWLFYMLHVLLFFLQYYPYLQDWFSFIMFSVGHITCTVFLVFFLTLFSVSCFLCSNSHPRVWCQMSKGSVTYVALVLALESWGIIPP